MNKKRLKYFKSIILKNRREVLRNETILASEGVNDSGNSDSVNPGYTTHMADLGSDTMGQELNSYFRTRGGRYLNHLDKALERIEKGTYGICIFCGNEIPEDRLEEVPHTRHCVPCKSQQDNNHESEEHTQ